jgi:hypothetical protein
MEMKRKADEQPTYHQMVSMTSQLKKLAQRTDQHKEFQTAEQRRLTEGLTTMRKHQSRSGSPWKG